MVLIKLLGKKKMAMHSSAKDAHEKKLFNKNNLGVVRTFCKSAKSIKKKVNAETVG